MAKQTGASEDLNPYHIAQQQFDAAARYIPDLDPGLAKFLKQPDRMIIVEFPITTTELFESRGSMRKSEKRLHGQQEQPVFSYCGMCSAESR